MSKTQYTNLLDYNLTYLNQTFQSNIFEKDFETDNNILFHSCVFKGIASFEKIQAREVLFVECKFENVLNISNSSFFTFRFTKCQFYKDTSFISNTCHSNTVFRNVKGTTIELNGEYRTLQFITTTLEKLLLTDVNSEYSQKDSKIEFLVENLIKDLKIKSFTNFSNIIFKGGEYEFIYFDGTFNNQINFERKIKNEHLHFESSIFKNRIDFKEGDFEYINFYRSSFQGLIVFHGYDILKNESSEISIKELTVHSSYFEKNVNLSIEDIKDLTLSNNNFKQILSFDNYNNKNKNSSYSDYLAFIRINLSGSNQGNIIIENVYADITISDINLGNIYFKNIDLHTLHINEFHNKGNISFTNLKSGVYLAIQNSIIGNFNLLNEDLNIFQEIVISNSNLKGLILSIYPKKIRSYSYDPKIGYGLEDKSKNNQNLKNIYNQLKQVAKSNGDIDHMNKYKSLELRKLIKTKRFGFDSILLFLNWISNNNGQSWTRGVLFTLIVAFMFFLLYIYSLGIELDLKNQYKDYILYISSFPKLELEKHLDMNRCWNVSLIIWISRILISYGIYQTVAAFRKYGKG